MSDVSITTGSRNIIIGSGPSNEGVWHRAVMVALELHKAGLWDGIAKLTLNYPYQLHQRIFGIERAKLSDLIMGIDYTIKAHKFSMRYEYDGHIIAWDNAQRRAVIIRGGDIVDWVKLTGMPRTLREAIRIVDEHNERAWEAKIALDEIEAAHEIGIYAY